MYWFIEEKPVLWFTHIGWRTLKKVKGCWGEGQWIQHTYTRTNMHSILRAYMEMRVCVPSIHTPCPSMWVRVKRPHIGTNHQTVLDKSGKWCHHSLAKHCHSKQCYYKLNWPWSSHIAQHFQSDIVLCESSLQTWPSPLTLNRNE